MNPNEAQREAAEHYHRIEAEKKHGQPDEIDVTQCVKITGVKIPFWDLATLIFKIGLAAIPAALAMGILWRYVIAPIAVQLLIGN